MSDPQSETAASYFYTENVANGNNNLLEVNKKKSLEVTEKFKNIKMCQKYYKTVTKVSKKSHKSDGNSKKIVLKKENLKVKLI